MWTIIIFQCDALERSRIQVHKMAWTCCVVSRGTEDRPRKEAGPEDGSSSHLFHFHSPGHWVLQAAEGWPCSLQSVGLPGLPPLIPWTWNLWGRRLALLCRFSWVILISPLLSHRPREWSNVLKCLHHGHQTAFPGSGTKGHLKCHPVLALESMVSAHTNEFSRQIMLNTLSFSF